MALYYKLETCESGQKCSYLFSQNNGNLFEFFAGYDMKINRKLKKDIEIYIRKNSKKILGGSSDGKTDKRIQTKNIP